MIIKRHFGIIGLLILALMMGGLRSPDRTATAQGTNLLVNGSLERPYAGQGAATRTVPQGWNLLVLQGAPEAFPHTDKVQVRDGEVSWNIKQGYDPFTAAAYQQVTTVKKGDVLEAKAYGWVYTCQDTTTSCVIENPPYRRSDTRAQASLKVGLDPTGGTDPNAASVKWSAAAAPYDQWAEMSIVATAEGSTVTMFMHMTQARGLALNNVYWDQASLSSTSSSPSSTNVPPTAAAAPFVVPQGVRPDGSIVHVVQSGDTLSSIAFAYNKDYGTTVLSIADLNDNIEPNTRFLQLGQEILILAPGSVDPVTGKLIPPEERAAASSPTPGTAETPAEGAETPAEGEPTTDPAAESPTADSAAAQEPTVEGTPGEPVATMEPLPQPSPIQVTVPPTETPTTEPLTTEPVEQQPSPTAQEVAASGLTATDGKLCITVYQDANLNMTHDTDETALTGAEIVLSQTDSADTSYTYDESSDPMCIDLVPGRYQVAAKLPSGYGMTTASSANVSLVSGHQVSVAFGGAENYTPPAAPEAVSEQETGEQVESGAVAPMVEVVVDEGDDEEKSALDKLYDNSGLLVLGFAGVIVLSSSLLLFAVRRFSR